MGTAFRQHFDLSLSIDQKVVFDTHSDAFEFRFYYMISMEVKSGLYSEAVSGS